MNKSALAIMLVVALGLGGCATSSNEIAHRERMYDKALVAHKEQAPTPACQIVGDGVNAITMSGIKSFTCYGDTKQAAVPTYVEPKSAFEVVVDKAIRVVEIAINPMVSLSIHKDNNATQRHMSDNSVKTHATTMGTIEGISNKGMDTIGSVASEGIAVGRFPANTTIVMPNEPATVTVPTTPAQ